MLEVKYSNRFNKDLKTIKKRKYDTEKLKKVILMLSAQIELPPQYRDHSLSGKYSDYRECHIEPDWLLIYKIENEKLILILSRTGTHSDLFK